MSQNQYRISDIFRERAVVSFLSSLAFLGVTFWYWSLPRWYEVGPISLAALVTVVLSFLLGRSASQLGISIGRAAFGISWRIACIWVVLAAITETLISVNFDAAATVTRFPMLFVPTIIVSEVAMLIGYVSRSTEGPSFSFGSAWRFTRRQIIPLVALAVSCVALALQIENLPDDAPPKPSGESSQSAPPESAA